jgi:Flp pilus assembly protein TadG
MLRKSWAALKARTKSFMRNRRGNVAMIFALTLVPMMIAAGAGVDLTRALVVRSRLAEALDAAGLAVGATQGLTTAQIQQLAQNYFNQNYTADSSYGTPVAITVAQGTNQVTLSTSVSMPTDVIRVADILSPGQFDSINVGYSSTVVWGQTKLWVSLVLDNTGSMCEPDANPCPGDTNTNIKINALKAATHSLLTTLQNASANPGDVKVAIVPFAKDVNVGTAYVNASWIDWTDWSTQLPVTPPNTTGPGDNCPWNASSSYGCVSTPGGNDNPYGTGTDSSTSTVPSSGTYKGYICPGPVPSSSTGQAGHYYNGCYTSTAASGTTVISGPSSGASCSGYASANCSCSGSGSSKRCSTKNWTHAWVLNPKSTWGGCVMDRNQDDDTDDATPGTLFPAENDDSCPSAAVTTLSYSWTNLSTQVDNMIAGGGTNQTIGLAHGMQMLVDGAPYSAGTLPANTTRYIILLSDGLNTMDRWYGNGSSQSSSVDSRMTAACTNAKNQGFVIYTIFVDLNGTSGNSSVLQNCASDSSKYFDLTTSGAIITTFNNIAQQITQLRVSR